MNEALRESIFEAYLTAALREHMRKEAESAPSDEELRKMFPRDKKDEKRLKEYIRLERKQEKRERGQSAPLVFLKRAAIIAMAVVSLSTAVMLTDTDIRAAVEHAVVEFFDKYAKVNFRYSDDAGDEVDIYKLSIGYIPDGYELIESDEEEPYRDYMYYSDKDDLFLSIGISYSNNTESDVDIEHMDMTEITVNGYNGYMFYNEEMQAGCLLLGNQVLAISVDVELSKDELIRIAENIK